MQITFISAVILLFIVMDPLGGIPLFTTVLRNVPELRRPRVILRECLIAFAVLLLFLLCGRRLLSWLQISETSLGISGGIILFLIAIRIIFPTKEGVFGGLPEGEPFIVPLAVPLIAGPSAVATVLLLVSKAPERLLEWIAALTLAVMVSTILLSLGARITRLLGDKGIMAIERLMGLVLTAISVEMFLNGVRVFVRGL